MTPAKIEQCKAEVKLIASVLEGIVKDMEADGAYISVSAHIGDKNTNGPFWCVTLHGNRKFLSRLDSEGIDGLFEEICGDDTLVSNEASDADSE